MIKDEIFFSHKYEKIGNVCFSCLKKDHFLKRCPLVTYQPDKAFIMNKFNYSKPQKRQIINRRNSKFNALISKKNTYKAALTLKFDKELINIFKLNLQSLKFERISEASSVYDSPRRTFEKSLRKSITFDHSKLKEMIFLKRSKSLTNDRSNDDDCLSLFESHTQEINQSKSLLFARKKSLSGDALLDTVNAVNQRTESKIMNEIIIKKDEFMNKVIENKNNEKINKMISFNTICSPNLRKDLKIFGTKTLDTNQQEPCRFSLKSPLLNSSEKEEESPKNKAKMNNPIKLDKNRKSIIFSRSLSKNVKKTEESSCFIEKGKNIYWMEFERMKFFKNYFKNNNSMSVLAIKLKKTVKTAPTWKWKNTLSQKKILHSDTKKSGSPHKLGSP